MQKRILRIKQVMDLTGLPKSSIYKAMKDGLFPKSVKLLGARSCGWFESDIQNFLSSKKEDQRINQKSKME